LIVDAESVTLHTSWRGIISSAAGAFLVLAAGILVVAAVGFRVLPTLVLIAGVAGTVIVLFDYPIAVTFDAEGFTRRTMLRRQRMPWSRIDQLSRSRPNAVAGFRKLAHGGLVAVIGRRRYMLVDRCESPDEFAELERILDPVDVGILERVPRPHPSASPTWLYRRARWAPEQPSDR
jgi:hypothetical protein